MDEDTKKEREKVYDSYNFAGITDWAVDLQSFQRYEPAPPPTPPNGPPF
jgi:hypothetical protein